MWEITWSECEPVQEAENTCGWFGRHQGGSWWLMAYGWWRERGASAKGQRKSELKWLIDEWTDCQRFSSSRVPGPLSVTFARWCLLPGRCCGWICGPRRACAVHWAPTRTQRRASQTGRSGPHRWSPSRCVRSSERSYGSMCKHAGHLHTHTHKHTDKKHRDQREDVRPAGEYFRVCYLDSHSNRSHTAHCRQKQTTQRQTVIILWGLVT